MNKPYLTLVEAQGKVWRRRSITPILTQMKRIRIEYSLTLEGLGDPNMTDHVRARDVLIHFTVFAKTVFEVRGDMVEIFSSSVGGAKTRLSTHIQFRARVTVLCKLSWF